MPATFLADLVESTREAVRAARRRTPLADLRRRVADAEPARDFVGAVAKSEVGGASAAHAASAPPVPPGAIRGLPRLIAELKQASPSKGVLRERYDPVGIARIYEESGACALSVLTEERFFRGALTHLVAVRAAVRLPLLRKDFTLDEYQIWEARAHGADAVLLIAALLDDPQLKDYLALTGELGMAALVEVHRPEEAERALRFAPALLGINNRDLESFKTDVEVTFRVLDRLPELTGGSRRDRAPAVVSESGIAEPAQLERLAAAGVDAVLVGESFMRDPDIAAAVRRLMGSGS
jgi:indole-3-glycerol phosphate synthase